MRQKGDKDMGIDRAKKDKIIKDVTEKFSKANATFVADYSGITANNMTDLRAKLRDAGGDFKIIRNTLAKRALSGSKVEGLGEHLKGTTAIAFSYTDAAAVAKTLTTYAKEDENLELKVGSLGDQVIDLATIKELSSLPSREELLGKLVGVMSNVPGSLVGVLSGVPRKLVGTLHAIGQSK